MASSDKESLSPMCETAEPEMASSCITLFATCPVPSSSTANHTVLFAPEASFDVAAASAAYGSHRALSDGICDVILPHTQKQRWTMIQQALQSTKIRNCDDLLVAVQQYSGATKDIETVRQYAASLQCEESERLFAQVLPKMIDLALSLPVKIQKPLARLTGQRELSVTLSQEQVACLLACAFFCMFSSEGTHTSANRKRAERTRAQRSINFFDVFSASRKPHRQNAKVQKLTCFVRYFDRVTRSMPVGVITYHRRVIDKTKFPIWSKCDSQLGRLQVSSAGLIEDDGAGMLQVDFANRCVGGGVLGDGCVQEEIRFTVCPELIVARLLADGMDDNECVVVVGCERFCDYVGYGDGFRFTTDHFDATPLDEYRRRRTEVVAMDATSYGDFFAQFRDASILRELNKAYCGFYAAEQQRSAGRLSAVATGNWGCGAYHGDHRLKAVIQLMAAAVNQRDVCYFTFGDRDLSRDIEAFHAFVVEKRISVGRLWQLATSYGEKRLTTGRSDGGKGSSVFEYVRSQHKISRTGKVAVDKK